MNEHRRDQERTSMRSRHPAGSKQVILIRDHTHAGAAHNAGEVLSLPPSKAAWLIENSIGIAAGADKDPKEDIENG